MKAMAIPVVVVALGVMASIAGGVFARPTIGGSPAVISAAIAHPDGVAVGERFLVPHLSDTIVALMPSAEQAGDRYLAKRVALADLVTGERILAAEDLANTYADDLPGFSNVLLTDGFRQDADGTWFYDPFSSWMRFALNR